MKRLLQIGWQILRCGALAMALLVAVVVALGVLAFIADMPGASRFKRYCGYPNKDALLAVETNDVVRCDSFTLDGTNVTLVVMKPCRFLASGSAMLVYDSDGKLVAKTRDEGDDGRFQRKWGNAWRKSLSDKTRRWLQETRLPEARLAAPATMGDFAAFMEQASKDFDRPGKPKDKRGIRFRCCEKAAKTVFPEKPKGEGLPPVASDSLANVSFWDALTNACERTGCEHRIYENEVSICGCRK